MEGVTMNQLAEHYQKQAAAKQQLISEYGQRIFELESTVADQDFKMKQLHASAGGQTGFEQLTAAQLRIQELEQALAIGRDHQNEIAGMKMEIDNSTLLQHVDPMVQSTQELESDIAKFHHWLNVFEKSTGIKPGDAAQNLIDASHKIAGLEQQLRNAMDIESALRTQNKNYEKRAKKAEDKASKTEEKLQTNQGRVKTLETQLKREKMIRDIDAMPATAASPKIPKGKTSAYSSARKCHDQDDPEDVKEPSAKKLVTPPTPRTPLGLRLGRSVQEDGHGRFR